MRSRSGTDPERDKADLPGVTSRPGVFLPLARGQEVADHERLVGCRDLGGAEKVADGEREPGFLPCLPRRGLPKRLAGLDAPTGERPAPRTGVVAASHEEDGAVLDVDDANAERWRRHGAGSRASRRCMTSRRVRKLISSRNDLAAKSPGTAGTPAAGMPRAVSSRTTSARIALPTPTPPRA